MGQETQQDGDQEPASVVEFRRTSACRIPDDAAETFRQAERFAPDSPDYAQMMAAGWASVLQANPGHPDATREYELWMGRIWGTPKNKN